MKCYCTIGKIAHVFEIFYLTMKNCLFGAFSQVQAREIQQNLSNMEKKILIKWITCFTIIEFLIFSKLVLEMIEEIY